MSEDRWARRLANIDAYPADARDFIYDLLNEIRTLRRERDIYRQRLLELGGSVNIAPAAPGRPQAVPATPRPVHPRPAPAPRPAPEPQYDVEPDLSAPPSKIMVITVSYDGLSKRTPVNHYGKQRRGGIGIYDLCTRDDDPVHMLVIADKDMDLLAFTNLGQAYRLPISQIPQAEVRGKGEDLNGMLSLSAGEVISALLPVPLESGSGYVTIASQGGFVRHYRRAVLGPGMVQGTSLWDAKEVPGAPVAACLTNGNEHVLLATHQGMGIRFPESTIPLRGIQAIKLQENDRVAGLLPVKENSSVAVVTTDGQGARRMMAGFSANQAPGGQGKILIKSQAVAAIAEAEDGQELMCISKFSKIIHFDADEIPAKTAPVQGVAVMEIRGDEVVAMAAVL
ncbi:MAG: hypothetical protein EXR62_13275 [Chloroflexi bacterium]|nr:hypothetical protein [Chloroflexota bacterium]